MDKNNESHIDCAVARTIKVIGSKWTMLIIHTLMTGEKRFGQLQQSLVGISSRTLSARLQELEHEGLIRKKIFAEVPLHVEYSLTENGKSLRSIFATMGKWGERVQSS